MHKSDFTLLNDQMLSGGIAAKHATRIVSELQQHLGELTENARSAGLSEQEAVAEARRKLGNKETILASALAKKELRTWSSKYTKTVYLLLPFLVYIALLIVPLYFSLALIPTLLGINYLTQMPGLFELCINAILFFQAYLLVPLMTVLICHLARTRRIDLFWPVAGIVWISFLGSGWDFSVRVPSGTERGDISMNWGYNFLLWDPIQPGLDATFRRLIRMVITLALAFTMLRISNPSNLFTNRFTMN